MRSSRGSVTEKPEGRSRGPSSCLTADMHQCSWACDTKRFSTVNRWLHLRPLGQRECRAFCDLFTPASQAEILLTSKISASFGRFLIWSPRKSTYLRFTLNDWICLPIQQVFWLPSRVPLSLLRTARWTLRMGIQQLEWIYTVLLRLRSVRGDRCAKWAEERLPCRCNATNRPLPNFLLCLADTIGIFFFKVWM